MQFPLTPRSMILHDLDHYYKFEFSRNFADFGANNG